MNQEPLSHKSTQVERNRVDDVTLVLGMDVAGEVVDAGTSTKFTKGDIILAPGLVGISDSCSFQTHVLVDERHCAKVGGEVAAHRHDLIFLVHTDVERAA